MCGPTNQPTLVYVVRGRGAVIDERGEVRLAPKGAPRNWTRAGAPAGSFVQVTREKTHEVAEDVTQDVHDGKVYGRQGECS